jgi:hypothetical protein
MTRSESRPDVSLALSGAATLVLMALTLSALRVPGTGDMEIWSRWLDNAMRLGVIGGFAENNADYPPLASVILWSTRHVVPAVTVTTPVAIKLSLAVFLGLAILLVFAWTGRRTLALGLWSALLLNSVCLGYLDIYTAPFLVLSFHALSRAWHGRALSWFGLACLVKWQPGLIAPFLLWHVLASSGRVSAADVRRVARMLLPIALMAVVLALVVGVVPFVLAFGKSLGHRSLSADALNLGWLITWVLQGVTHGAQELFDRVVYVANAPLWLRLLLKALFAGQFLWLLWRYVRGPAVFERTTAYAVLGFLAYIVFNNGVHENHWFVPCLLSIVLVNTRPVWRWPAVAMCVMANLNLLLFYGFTGQGPGASRVVGIDLTVPLAALAIMLYAWMWNLVRRQDARYSTIRQ